MINKLKKIIYLFLNPKIKLSKIPSDLKINIANIGSAGEFDFSGLFWTKISDFCHFFNFDPDNSKVIRKNNSTIFPYGLWDSSTSKNIFITKFPFASSFFEPNDVELSKFINFDAHTVIKKREVNLISLDEILNNESSHCDFIKIDAEGSELKILNGATKNLKICLGLEIEINFLEKNINSSKAVDILNFCEQNNFTLFILSRESWRKNTRRNITENFQIIWADAVFFLSEKEMVKRLQLMDRNKVTVTIQKLILLFLNYKLYDSAENYIRHFYKEGIIETENLKSYLSDIRNNIESNVKVYVKTLLLFFITLLIFPCFLLIPVKKVRNSSISFFKILFIRLLILTSNIFRYSGPQNVAVSDNLKNI